MKKHHLTSLVLLSLSLWGCKSSIPPLTAAPPQSLVKQWEANLDLGGDRISALHLRNNALIVYTEYNKGYWINATGGGLMAVNQIARYNHSVHPPVALKDHYIIPTTIELRDYNSSGEEVSTYAIPTAIQSTGAGSGNSIYLGVAGPGAGRLAKFTLGDKLTNAWEMYTTAGVVAAPAVSSDAIFVGGLDGRVWALDGNRNAIWSLPDNCFKTDGPITADLSVDEFGVYVASQDQKLYCLDHNNGKIKWIYYSEMPLVDRPIVLGNNVYQIVPNRGLMAINKTEGPFDRKPIWTQRDATQILSVDERFLYVHLTSGAVGALDLATGKVQFQSRRADLSIFATNLQNPMIYAATPRGKVYAVRPVLKPGTVGELVLAPTLIEQPLAMLGH